jgi:aerobic carbon-monoxide dehydrogenase medium subunit
MLRRFQVHQPASMEEALALRSSLGEDATPYAGGTELLLIMKLGLAHWPHLIDLKRIRGLERIEVGTGVVRIGACATHRAVERDAEVRRLLPALARLEAGVANVRVRAAGTLAGNLAFAEPHADPPALLVALGARVVIAGPGGERSLPVERFLTGAYETALAPDELMVAVVVPIPAADVTAAYLNFRVLERPTLGVAVAGRLRQGRFVNAPTVVVGAVDEVPRRVPAAPLKGAGPGDPEAVEAVMEAARAAVEPAGDLAGSAEYKRHLTGVFVKRAVEAMAGQEVARV